MRATAHPMLTRRDATETKEKQRDDEDAEGGSLYFRLERLLPLPKYDIDNGRGADVYICSDTCLASSVFALASPTPLGVQALTLHSAIEFMSLLIIEGCRDELARTRGRRATRLRRLHFFFRFLCCFVRDLGRCCASCAVPCVSCLGEHSKTKA